jgi:hypothetical protein
LHLNENVFHAIYALFSGLSAATNINRSGDPPSEAKLIAPILQRDSGPLGSLPHAL